MATPTLRQAQSSRAIRDRAEAARSRGAHHLKLATRSPCKGGRPRCYAGGWPRRHSEGVAAVCRLASPMSARRLARRRVPLPGRDRRRRRRARRERSTWNAVSPREKQNRRSARGRPEIATSAGLTAKQRVKVKALQDRFTCRRRTRAPALRRPDAPPPTPGRG
mgnify:CR=1 FL=1